MLNVIDRLADWHRHILDRLPRSLALMLTITEWVLFAAIISNIYISVAVS